jgi:uncharacterized protein (TIRG00374 family)
MHGGEPRVRLGLQAALKLAVTAGLLSWLLGRTDIEVIGEALAGAGRGWVCAAFALHFVGLLISAVRWRLLLRAQGAEVPLPFLARSLLVGTFFNNFLPSTVGGDLMRARDTAAHAGSGTGALTVVLVERASGILVLGFFAVAAPLAGALGHGGAASAASFATAALLAGFAACGLLLRPRTLAALRRIVHARTASGAGRGPRLALVKADRLLQTLEALAGAPKIMRTTLFLAVLLQANVILHFWCVAKALDLSVEPGAFLLIVPVATVLLLLPVSINGIGAREAVFAFLLGRYGVPLAQALAFSWIAYGTVLGQGLLGGLVYALRRKS